MKNILMLVGFLVLISCENKEKKENIELFTAKQHAEYEELTNEASKLYYAKEYLRSAQKYSKAFKIIGNENAIGDRYDAACSWAMANKIDSSFTQLFINAKKDKYSNYGHIKADTDLSNLHSDKRWEQLLEIISKNKEDKEVNFDKPLVAILDSVHIDDQSVRSQFHHALEKYGSESDEFKNSINTMLKQDSINIMKIEKILDKYGWLGEDIIGESGNKTLFLVIQHAQLKVQEKYLPMLRKAVKNKNAKPSELALLEDRVAMRNGKKQIYGSQTKIDKTGKSYFTPIEDPENVDKRRISVGLVPMADYASMFNITWDIESHKEMTKKIESEKE